MDRRLALMLAMAALALVLVVVCFAVVSTWDPTPAPRRKAPNVVFIMTDDQDAQLGSMDFMPRTRRLVGDEGVTLDHYYVTTSLCCPSRTSLLTGQFCHNHGLWENDESRNGGLARFIERGLDRANLATWLKEAGGYTTSLMGKFLNGYHDWNATYIPPGWDRWFVCTQETISKYDATCYSDQGVLTCPKNAYQTDTLRDKAVEFINAHRHHNKSGSSGADQDEPKPFFLQINPHAPHRPCLPAERHRHMFLNEKAPRTPSFNASQQWQDTKVSWIRNVPPLTQAQADLIDENWVLRLQSLQAVDELVEAVVDALAANDLLDDTYVFYTSDNGWHLGQHRLQWGKRQAYEEDIRVPMLVRGPGIPRGANLDGLVANIDMTATVLDIAGLNASSLRSYTGQPLALDGVSVLGALKKSATSTSPAAAAADGDEDEGVRRQVILVEGNYTEDGTYAGQYDLYAGLRVLDGAHDLLFVNWTSLGKQELYDLVADPYQLRNIADTYPEGLKKQLACVLERLATCSGSDCSVSLLCNR